MTGPERQTLELLSSFVRDWRLEDTKWKESMDERMRKVELFVAAETTEEQMVTAATISRRALITTIVAVLGICVTAVLGVVNLVT